MRQINEEDLNMQINIDRKNLSDGLMLFSLMKANLTFTKNFYYITAEKHLAISMINRFEFH